MGSEMCIRDSVRRVAFALSKKLDSSLLTEFTYSFLKGILTSIGSCLLYTSDAADERSSVDLGGRRIIKKKNSDRKSLVVVNY